MLSEAKRLCILLLPSKYIGPSLRSELVTFLLRFMVAQSYK
jgi:hypothetical protein